MPEAAVHGLTSELSKTREAAASREMSSVTAQTCSACGHVERAVADGLGPRWRCPECGTVHDRKGNGAQNVLETTMWLIVEAAD